ncbi:MAG TPA: hypothetical protein VJN92_20055 [Candidatus Acidoferrum sp.]|nr:hypothetical protein [Candidatus Acidoferrum sp.]
MRLNSAIGYITPKNMLAGHQQEIQQTELHGTICCTSRWYSLNGEHIRDPDND